MTIDRSAPLETNPPYFPEFSAHFMSAEENSASRALASIDPARVELQTVFDPDEMNGVAPEAFNERIDARLRELSEKWILLDAAVAGALLTHPEAMLSDWARITDADVLDDASGSIGFYGTRFFKKSDTEHRVPLILTPFCNRGSWLAGFDSVYFDTDTIAKASETAFSRRLAAVYPR